MAGVKGDSIVVVQSGLYADVQELVKGIKENPESLVFTGVLLVSIIGLYFRSPWYQRQKEETQRLRQDNTDLIKSIAVESESASANNKLLQHALEKLNQLESCVSQSDRDISNILFQIGEIREDIRVIQTQLAHYNSANKRR